MQMYILARGEYDHLNRYINSLMSQYYPYKIDGKTMALQLGVRPIQMFEIAFPEPVLDSVMKTVYPSAAKKGTVMRLLTYGLRKTLGADKMPQLPKKPLAFVPRNFVDVMGIGIRRDKMGIQYMQHITTRRDCEVI